MAAMLPEGCQGKAEPGRPVRGPFVPGTGVLSQAAVVETEQHSQIQDVV